jgi:hypothetical protein
MSERVWFVILAGKKEGPFSISQLLRFEGITPDTLAWKEGMPKWVPIREVAELKELFAEQPSPAPLIEEVKGKSIGMEDLALSLPHTEPPLLFWILFFLIMLVYALLQLHFSS